ncbi:uncharacterized protein LOC119641761 [Glossina fuscipes]|uniref:Uncharacterized protein LOC119641761 n=1 Tax=Glossina fuscipes TaxID=7396 RepID=A0A9C6DY14_9MUSC|nr:uncharacterized protein LOC119641761 [Glossina fuscipes]
MRKITQFDKKVWHLWKYHLHLPGEDCDIYSIWNFRPEATWRTVKKFFGESASCKAHWFPIVYWTVLALSIMGSIYSASEFARLFLGNRKQVTMWRRRTYYVLPYSVLRKCRLVGALIMLNVWLLLFYAIINVSSVLMMPWLIIKLFTLGLEFVYWLLEMLFGSNEVDASAAISFLLPVITYQCVRCVYNIFLKAVELNDIENLLLWKR